MMRAMTYGAALAMLAWSTIARAQGPSPVAAVPAHPVATSAAPPAPALLAPGTIINASNADQYANFIPAAAMLAIRHGLRLEVTPTHRIAWSTGYQTATEKYSPQVGLDKDDYITNYIAGMPFPLIDLSDPKAAVKVAYNWHFGPVLPDDFSLSPWTVNGYLAEARDPTQIHPSNDLDNACEQFDFLRYAHRTEVEPRPTLGSNSLGVEWKARCNQWTTVSMGVTPARARGFGFAIRILAATMIFMASTNTRGGFGGWASEWLFPTRSAADAISHTGRMRCRKPRSTSTDCSAPRRFSRACRRRMNPRESRR